MKDRPLPYKQIKQKSVIPINKQQKQLI